MIPKHADRMLADTVRFILALLFVLLLLGIGMCAAGLYLVCTALASVFPG